MDTRVAVISIIVENPEAIETLNHLLHEAGQFIIGRMGIPSGTKQWNYQFRFLDRGRRRGSRYLKNRKIPERCLFPAE